MSPDLETVESARERHVRRDTTAAFVDATRHTSRIMKFLEDLFKTFLLIWLSFFGSIFSLSLLGFCSLVAKLYRLLTPYVFPHLVHRELCREKDFEQYTILVTGVGMAKGLALARAFYMCGHEVIAADFDAEKHGFFNRFYSKAFHRFVKIRCPNNPVHTREQYIADVKSIIHTYGVDLWVPCSGVASALEDALVMEAIKNNTPNTKAVCIQFDLETTVGLHEKNSFMRHLGIMQIEHPETYTLFSQVDLTTHLDRATARNPGRRFILKPAYLDDYHRGDMTLLPRDTEEQTRDHIRKTVIDNKNPYILQQFIPGGKEYCTHALVIEGEVKTFVACPSAELLMHYEALPQTDILAQRMLAFTQDFARRYGFGEPITGHLSFDFMVEEVQENGVYRTILYPIECNPRVHTAVVLFSQPGKEMRDMVAAYLSAIKPGVHQTTDGLVPPSDETSSADEPPVVWPPTEVTPRYWIGHDLVTLFVLPLWRTVTTRQSWDKSGRDVGEFLDHLLHWKEGTFELWDMWPGVALYHRYWPDMIFAALATGQRWSRLNVSTTKMFSKP